MPPAHRPKADEATDRDFQRALALQKQGQLDAAAALYKGVLKRRPRHVDALQLLGTLQGQRGLLDEAIALLNQALALDPGHVRALNNLGRALAQSGREAEALQAFDRSLALRPSQPAALIGRGRVLRKLGRHDEALACFDELLRLDAGSSEALAQRAQLLSLMARGEPRHREAAIAAIRAALPYSSQPEDALYALASLGAGPVPAASPRHYVTSLFDDYADSFDRHLTTVLRYQLPERMGAAVQRAGRPAPGLALDLGCGTGLCGLWMRPLAKRLLGVDLSPRMLDKARERELYDELVCADLVDFLQGLQQPASLIAAADVFIYLGDLAAVFAATARVLQPGGLLVFSIESQAEGGYALQESRRYAHGRSYIEHLAASQAYVIASSEPLALRQESGQDVMGELFVLRRPG